MRRVVRILRGDWNALAVRRPEVNDRAEHVLERGRIVLEKAPPQHVPGFDRLRHELAVKAGSVALLRFELVSQREQFAAAERQEKETYERHLELDRDVVPPLKLEAKRLRAEVRRLEAEAAGRGIDVERIEPAINWDATIAVDAYQRPRYESNEERRRAAVEFFRRVAGS